MKNRKLQLISVFTVLALVALACGFNFSTANITSARLSADSSGTPETTVFTPDQVFYCIVEVANAPNDTTVKAAWTAVNVEGEAPNTFIDETEITAGNENIFTFNLSNTGSWPRGQYKVDIYLNDELDRTLEFEVQ